MEIKYIIKDSLVDVKLQGELDTPATIEIQEEIDKLIEHSSKELIIDCSELNYIASSGLRQFILIHKKCKAEGGKMILTGVSPDIMEIFAVTHFDKVFDIR